MTAIAKITTKGQTTVPQEIRAALGVKPGDLIAWDAAADGSVRVRRIQPIDLESLRAAERTPDEWAGAADEEAYRGL
ncbi:MAG: type II toxin-antitoxin system PrlF family antitoxin [Betaproteobacteria bacterium]|uniref:Type II toxin-antitoxin system PrlF family antitoxin n=1 Tax=Candidatus Proximibacter danicus TaxID=2954365 RepID=A0A9D7K1G4_9PROT|nr:type II toxin-antitoxin system PrlF family antitoxin [Candidatus Proximibacter danicus]